MNYHIEESAFNRIFEQLQHEGNIHVSDRQKVRIFIEAVYWMARSGAQWRFLPKEYGYWNTVYQRFRDWSDRGVFKRMFLCFSSDCDLEWLMIDSTIVRAHACASGAKGGNKIKRLDEVRAAIAVKYTLA